MKDVLAVVLAGGKGSRLEPLTRDRAKPAVPFGGIYRIIDFTLSNCLNSGIRKILVLTQYKAMSLARHVTNGWRHLLCRELGEFIDVVPPQQRIDEQWYQGTADAVYQNIYTLEQERPRHVVILAGDHIYKMDYSKMVADHIESKADLTIAALKVNVDEARAFGVMQIDGTRRIVGFEEKSPTPKTIPGDPEHCLASMGIYVFNAPFLFDQLCQDATMPGGLSIQALGEDETGEIYAAPPSGPILAFQAAGTTGPETPMPATLSATGLFSDTPALTAAAGLIDYSINAPFWSNGAQKRRWFRLPAGSTIGFDAAGAWTFPVGTITVKHFDLGTTKVETRVMVHRTDGWRGFSYRWRADGQDADLVAENGDTATYANQAWNFPSRTQCLQCHTAPSRALGLNTRQFNASHSYASTGRSDNQLRTLNHIGIFSSDIGDAGQYATMPNPADPSAGTIEARARAYLDTNCSICHQPGGGTPVDMDLRFGGTLADLKIINVAASQSTATRVLPGDPSGSDLWQRLQSSGANRMPPVGVQVVDQEAVQLLSTWITQLQ
jgi:uncharacterized repeat protein (TIGR03806 family)